MKLFLTAPFLSAMTLFMLLPAGLPAFGADHESPARAAAEAPAVSASKAQAAAASAASAAAESVETSSVKANKEASEASAPSAVAAPAAAAASAAPVANAKAEVVISSAAEPADNADKKSDLSSCPFKKKKAAGFCPYSARKCKSKGFFSFHIASEFNPYRYMEFDQSAFVLGYGKRMFLDAASMEFHLRLASLSHMGAGVKLELDLMKGVSWTPGIDTALSFAAVRGADADPYFAARYGLGGYVKAFVSKSFAMMFRGGLSYELSVGGPYFTLENLNMYLGVGIKKYFL